MKKLLFNFMSLTFLFSCGEEALITKDQDESFTSQNLEAFEVSTCSQMTFRKPPVDILYVIDNSGSTLASSFQSIKYQIQQTINNISNEFDYHIYFAPLHPAPSDSIQGYPVMVSDPDTITSIASVNLTTSDNISMFAQASGNNEEYGFERAKNLIQYNRSNGIFRNESNTIVVMISNGDDTEAQTTIQGNKVFDSGKYSQIREELKKFTKSYAQANTVTNPLNAQAFRFISLVAHSNCNNWQKGTTYQMMSKDLYEYQSFSDNSSGKDSVDLCSQNYSEVFSAVNNSIQAVVEGHKYDHWKISSSSESGIQTDDITVSKLKKDGTKENILPDTTNGFEYLGHKTDQKLNYAPADSNETATGLVIKLNGNARVEYPDCIIAKTRTPTEYFGYFAIPREPDLTSVKVEINGQPQPQSTGNGWTYLGWRDTLNIKVPGSTNVAVTPELNKSGYMLQLHGDAIFTNGDTIKVYYKPKGK
jgi:hypothetical protein